MFDRETSSSWMSTFHNHLMGGRQVVLADGVVDRFLANGQYQSLSGFLDWYLVGQGYEVVGHYDPVDGLRFVAPEMQGIFARIAAPSTDTSGANSAANVPPPQQGSFVPTQSPAGGTMNAPGSAGFGQVRPGMQPPLRTAPVCRMPVRDDNTEDVLQRIRQALRQAKTPVAMVIEFADKLVSDPERQPEEERKLTVLLEKIVEEAAFLKRGKLQGRRNVLVMVAKNSGAIPPSVYQNNPLVTVLRLSRPDQNERRSYFTRHLEAFHSGDQIPGEQRKRITDILGDITDGLAAWDLETIRRISVAEQISVQQPKKLVDYFKFGRIDDPWKNLDLDKICEALSTLRKRVLGQSHAVKAVSDMLFRARGGISVERSNGIGGQPKGVLWFCGPTGVGKTELTKALAEMIFGDEAALHRFDMGEYGEPHTRQRLIGAPPSYVGYDQGGELTGRCQSKPAAIFLFDEIEKAHSSLLDIFLGILDAGRLTDSKGQTAYFSKSCIVFTSNEGGSLWSDLKSTASEDLPTYEEVRDHYVTATKRYITERLKRPELLNRLGENIVAFDILRPEFFPEICNGILGIMGANAREEYDLDLDFSDGQVTAMICDKMRAMENFVLGGRKIRELIKTHVQTPLSREIPFMARPAGGRVKVSTSNDFTRFLVNGAPVE